MNDFDIVDIESPRILRKAEAYLSEAPRTVTAAGCDRSEGGPHDYYSEGDYLTAWERLEADPTTFEALRNLPLRHPLLWTT